MGVPVAGLLGNLGALFGGTAEGLFGFPDPVIDQIFAQGLSGLLAEDHAQMAGTEMDQVRQGLQGQILIRVIGFDMGNDQVDHIPVTVAGDRIPGPDRFRDQQAAVVAHGPGRTADRGIRRRDPGFVHAGIQPGHEFPDDEVDIHGDILTEHQGLAALPFQVVKGLIDKIRDFGFLAGLEEILQPCPFEGIGIDMDKVRILPGRSPGAVLRPDHAAVAVEEAVGIGGPGRVKAAGDLSDPASGKAHAQIVFEAFIFAGDPGKPFRDLIDPVPQSLF